jgi:hypothetical protein
VILAEALCAAGQSMEERMETLESDETTLNNIKEPAQVWRSSTSKGKS